MTPRARAREGTPDAYRFGMQSRLAPRVAAPSARAMGRGADAAESRPDALLWAVALMVWTYVWRIQDLFPVLGKLEINLVASAIAFALFAIDRHPARRVAYLKTPILGLALGIFALGIVGIPTSLWAARSATFVLTGQLPNLALMMMIAVAVRGMRDLEWIALVNLVGACFHALFVQLTFEVGPDGRLGRLIYYDVNDLALVLVCTIPFAVFLLAKGDWRSRALVLLGGGLIVVTIGEAGSRGAFIGLVAVTAYIIAAFRSIPRRIRLIAAVGTFGLLSVLASDAYWERLRLLTNPEQDYNWSDRSPEGRMEVWKRGLGYMADRPLLGVGMRNFDVAEGTLSRESKAREERGAGFKWSAAHNSFLEIGVELGILGLALFIGMLIAALRSLWRMARRSTSSPGMRESALAFALTASLIGFIVCGFFVSAWYFSFLYMVLGLVMGLAKIDRMRRVPRPTWPGWNGRMGGSAAYTPQARAWKAFERRYGAR